MTNLVGKHLKITTTFISLLVISSFSLASESMVKWEVTGNPNEVGLRCTNPDYANFFELPLEMQICKWYCRDYKSYSQVDVVVVYELDKGLLYLRTPPSKRCTETDFHPSADIKYLSDEVLKNRIRKQKAQHETRLKEYKKHEQFAKEAEERIKSGNEQPGDSLLLLLIEPMPFSSEEEQELLRRSSKKSGSTD